MDISPPRFILGSPLKIPSLLTEMSLLIIKIYVAIWLIKAVNQARDCKSYSLLLCTLSKIISFYDTLPKNDFIPPNLPLAKKQPSLDWAILQLRLLSCWKWDMTYFWGKEPLPPTLATQNASSTILRLEPVKQTPGFEPSSALSKLWDLTSPWLSFPTCQMGVIMKCVL